MSEEKPTKKAGKEDVEALKARNSELETENEKLRATIAEAMNTLTAYVEKERQATVRQILEKANLCEDELEKLDLSQLKLLLKGIDSVRGTRDA